MDTRSYTEQNFLILNILPAGLLVLLCLYQFYPLYTGVCMWRDCSIQLNYVDALSRGHLPYRDLLFPHTPVSLLWPLLFVKLLGLKTFSFILAQTAANVLILILAFAAAHRYARFYKLSQLNQALLCSLWPFVLHAVFLNKMVLPFYNNDWLLWLMAAVYGHSLLQESGKNRMAEILFYSASLLALLSNPRSAGLFAGLLWLHRSISNKEIMKPMLALCLGMAMLWLHRMFTPVPEMPALLQRSDGYYASYRLSDSQQLIRLMQSVWDSIRERMLALGLLAGTVVWTLLMQRKRPSGRGILFSAGICLLYVLSTALRLTDHYPNFDYRALCVLPALLLFAGLVRKGTVYLLFSSALLLTFVMPVPWQGKKDYSLSHIRESNLHKTDHYRTSASAYYPQTEGSGFTFLSDSTELAYKKQLQPYLSSRRCMHLTQPQYPHYLNGQSISDKGLPLWYDYLLSTNDTVFDRVITLIKSDSVRYLQLDRFNIHFAGHHFASNVIQTLNADTTCRVTLELAIPMPTALRGDSTFVYHLEAIK